MQVIILAAGSGTRLTPLTNRDPKSLVTVNGTSILVNALNALSEHKEVSEAIIVVGYKKDLIKKEIGPNFKGIKIRYVENDNWENTNNLYSLWIAQKYVKTDFILMEGDIFFEPKILNPLFERRDRSIVLLGKYESYMSGTVAEVAKQDSTVKKLHLYSMQDQSFVYTDKFKTINICSFTFETFNRYLKPTMEMHIGHCVHDYWELILGGLIYLHTPSIYAHIVDNIKWFEIDNENDLDAAEKLFKS